MVYADHSVQDTIKTKKDGGSHFHPCSPEGLSANPPLNFFQNSSSTARKLPGFLICYLLIFQISSSRNTITAGRTH
jgi:hypothetical protein